MKYGDDLVAAINEQTRAAPDALASWLPSVGFEPGHFITLTFRDHGLAVGADKARWWWRRLVEALNRDVGGKHYQRKWKHSYFSYVCALEYQRNGNAHLHAVCDNWLDYAKVHEFWQANCGFAWIKKIVGDTRPVLRYVVKYILKSNELPLIWMVEKPVIVERINLNPKNGNAEIARQDQSKAKAAPDVNAGEQCNLWD